MQDSPYDPRSGVSECMRSIEPVTLKLLRDIHAPFVDFECLLHAVLPAGTAAGWSEGEVKLALRAVVAHLQPADMAGTEDCKMLEGTTEHVGFLGVRCP